MNIVFALAMVLINVPRRPGRTFNTFANTIATMYAIAPPLGISDCYLEIAIRFVKDISIRRRIWKRVGLYL